PTLLEWFPNSRVIHTFRDPRGIFASESRRRKKLPRTFPYKQLQQSGPLFTLYILLQVTYTWLRAVRQHFEYQTLYPGRYYLLKFEDVVTDPENSIKELCTYLGVDFQDAMLEQRVVSRGFRQGQAGFDQRAAERWKEINPPWVNTWFLFLGRKHLQKLGYAG
ncbi:MAG: sulfotransferase, partial [Deltaproteobacteria bacterium]